MVKKFFLIFTASILLFSCQTQKLEDDYILAPENFDEFLLTYGDILEIDSFEYGINWQTLNESDFKEDFDLSSDCKIDDSWSSEGNFSLKCKYRGSFNSRETSASFLYKNKIETFWKNAKFLAVIIHNPNMDCIRIAAGIDDFISEAYICPPGDHLLLIDVTDYANELKNTPDTSIVNKLTIRITEIENLNSKSDCFYIDNIRLIMDNSNQIQTYQQIDETVTEDPKETEKDSQ